MFSPVLTINNRILKNIGTIEAARAIIDEAPLIPAYERQFQQEACALTLRGAAAGCAISALGFWAMGQYMRSLDNSSIPSLGMRQEHFILLLGVVVSCAIVAWATARISVMKQLKQML